MTTAGHEAAVLLDEIRRAFRLPFVPTPLAQLAEARGYLHYVWPRIADSVASAGFLGSGLYLADMALAEVEAVYEPVLDRSALITAGLTEGDLAAVTRVIDLFHYTQPQLLLCFAALAEAFGRPVVGGYGKPDPRTPAEREADHLALPLVLATPDTAPLPAIAEALNLDTPPDLYRALARWPVFVAATWDELQYLVTYPEFRRRGRGLYYYARSGARFLAQPLHADADALRQVGLRDDDIASARAVVESTLPALAMMAMHAEALRVALGIHAREVVQPA